MPVLRRPQMTQSRPEGPAWVVDQAWKDEVLARIAANRAAGVQPRSVNQLAKLCGVTSPALSEMLKKPGESSTRVLPQINQVLGMASPSPYTVDQHRAHVMAKWSNLTPEDHEEVRRLVDHLARKG